MEDMELAKTISSDAEQVSSNVGPCTRVFALRSADKVGKGNGGRSTVSSAIMAAGIPYSLIQGVQRSIPLSSHGLEI